MLECFYKMNNPTSSGFGINSILGLVFMFFGAFLLISLTSYKLPFDISGAEKVLQYGAALGSILGGLTMLFKKKMNPITTIKP